MPNSSPPPITVRVGPLTLRVIGDRLIGEWAKHVFEVLATDAEPDVIVRSIDLAVHPCKGGDVTDDGCLAVGGGRLSFQAHHFDVEVRRTGQIEVEMRRRDRRPLWLRSLADPEEAIKMWLSHGSTIDTHLLKEFAYSILPYVLQCALLERSAGLIHASAFSVGGRGVLLPAWGGVGKSTMVSRAVLHGPAKFIADDHTVIDSNGTMHLYTVPIHVYSYHLSQDALLKQRTMAAISSASRLQWPIGSRLRRRKAVRWVRPQDLFTSDKIAAAASIDEVVVMFRGQGDDFTFEECSAEEAAMPCVGVILREIGSFVERLAGGSSGWSSGPFPSVGAVHDRLRAVYEQAFSGARCARLLTPKRTSPDELASFLTERSPLIAESLGGPSAARVESQPPGASGPQG